MICGNSFTNLGETSIYYRFNTFKKCYFAQLQLIFTIELYIYTLAKSFDMLALHNALHKKEYWNIQIES